jgi:hypothetical protein
MTSIQNKYRTSLRSVVVLPTNCMARSGLGQHAPLDWFGDPASFDGVLDAGLFRSQAETLRLYRVVATMDATAPLPSTGRSGAHLGLRTDPCDQLGAETIG